VRIRNDVFVLLALVLAPAPILPQTITTADIAGTITDASGAVVPNATVTVRNEDTNDTRAAVTSESGQYRFSLLPPGKYVISAATSGLKSNTQKVRLNVGQAQETNLAMTVQGTQEVIEVRSEASVVQTENANLTTSVSHEQVVDLPMNGGDLTTVAFTAPGVRMNVGGGNGNLNANGIPLVSVLFTLNGADVMDPYNNLNNSGASNNLLGANEVAEAAVVLNAFSAQYGRMAGAQVNLVGKTGSNAYHGNAIYNYNDAIMNANSFFANATSTPKGRSVANLYAASLGGKLIRNKTFFFVDTEALRYALPSSVVVSIPSVELENYALAHAVPSAIPLYQVAIELWNNAPGLSRAVPVTNGTGLLQDSNNHLGCGTHTFGVGATANPYVNGTSGPRFGIDVPCARAFGANNSSVNVENLFIAKVDHNLNDRQKLAFRYQYDWGLQATSTSPISHLFDSKSSQPQHSGQMSHTYVITPGLVNNFIGQSSWYTAIFGVLDFAATQQAIPLRLSLGDGGARGGGFPTLGATFPTGRNVGQLQLIDDLSWVKGSHTLKAGINWRYNTVTDTSLSSGTIAGTYSLSDIADFVSGVVNGTNQGSRFTQSYPQFAAAHVRVYSLDFYASDEWAASKKVKLQLGMRFEKDNNPVCADNCFSRMSTEFLAGGYPAGSNVPYNQTIVTGLHTAYKNHQGVIPEPRFGIVYTPWGQGRTVIRGGVGLFSSLPAASVSSNVFNNAPAKFSPSVSFGNVGPANDPSTSAAAAVASFQVFESSFAKGFTLAQINQELGGRITFTAPNYYSPTEDFRPAKVAEWSLEIEHPITARNVLAMTYAGNHGYDESIANPSLNNYLANPSRFPNEFADLPLTQPDPRFGLVTQVMLHGISNYNGLSVQIRHAYSHGFVAQFAYTWSHGLSLGSVVDPRNLNFGYSNTSIDNRHQMSGDFVWNMPRLRNRLLERAVGGWMVGVKAYIYSGRPFSVINSQLPGQIYANFGGTIYADLKDFSILGKHCGRDTVNTPCFTQSQFVVATTSNPGLQTDYGNIPPNSFYGPGYFNLDSQVTKAIRFRDRWKLEIGASAYNTLNHANFGNPSGTVTLTSLGLIGGTVSPPVSIYGSGQGAIVSGRVLVVMGKLSF
jgi:hypothetical protein